MRSAGVHVYGRYAGEKKIRRIRVCERKDGAPELWEKERKIDVVLRIQFCNLAREKERERDKMCESGRI